MFQPLSEHELARIVDLSIDRLQQRLSDRRLTLGVTPEARAWLAHRGYDPHYGARPLRRLIQRSVEDQLARTLLAGEVRDGDTVRVDLDGDKLRLEKM